MKGRNRQLPIIPLREMVAFPGIQIPILVGREKSLQALNLALKDFGGQIFLSAQRDHRSEEPNGKDIFPIGIIAQIVQQEQKGNGMLVQVEGLCRAHADVFETDGTCVTAWVEELEEDEPGDEEDISALEAHILGEMQAYATHRRLTLGKFLQHYKRGLPFRTLVDTAATMLHVPVTLKQGLLEELHVNKRAVKVINLMKRERSRLEQEQEQEEGGTSRRRNRDDKPDAEVEKYSALIEGADLPDHVRQRATEELERFSMMPPFSTEGSVSRYYLDWLLGVPWKKTRKEKKRLDRATTVLDQDHYGMQRAKDRILDYLAVRQLSRAGSGADGEILCLVGPPGVGKTSLARSVARALGRDFIRVSLGGVRDEAEIRGHRRTYVGAYPGQIVRGLRKAGSANPVFLLDEIDKMTMDFRGDPASALLEVLDPQQNAEFVDHFLDLELDLSRVFFIATANHVDQIPPALRDRLELVELNGYTPLEKLHIARRYLIPRQASRAGVDPELLRIEDDTLQGLIMAYTRESGVRDLERHIGRVMRKIARQVVSGKERRKGVEPLVLNRDNLKEYLGFPRYSEQPVLSLDEVGVAVGLAWTQAGGDILLVEGRLVPGKGDLVLTGRLGEVMRESGTAAWSYVRARLGDLELDLKSLERYNVHIHLPEGAVPKEGPSAGVTLGVTLISLLTGIPVCRDVAMTGEISLRGRVLPVGGIKEKAVAAHRYGLKRLIIPRENLPEYEEEVPLEVQESVQVLPVEHMEEVLPLALVKPLLSSNVEGTVLKPLASTPLQ